MLSSILKEKKESKMKMKKWKRDWKK